MTAFLFDQHQLDHAQALLPFVLTDCFLDEGQLQKPLLHFWQLQDTFILGMKDTKVPSLKQGITTLYAQHLTPIVRNSGGLGVCADEGVLNLTYLFKKNDAIQTIDDAYTLCLNAFQQAFPELVIEAYEIKQSYCPGTFDLSVNGQKIAGMAQRRIKENVAVMIYLSVNGNQVARGQKARAFYEASQAQTTKGYPDIDPMCMTTLEALLDAPISVAEAKGRLQRAFHATQEITTTQTWLSTLADSPLFQKRMASMVERNQVLQGE